MTITIRPSKEQVRKFMQQRQVERTPPPTPEEIKRQLGWKMIEDERRATGRE
jgi:hypothetical protein